MTTHSNSRYTSADIRNATFDAVCHMVLPYANAREIPVRTYLLERGHPFKIGLRDELMGLLIPGVPFMLAGIGNLAVGCAQRFVERGELERAYVSQPLIGGWNPQQLDPDVDPARDGTITIPLVAKSAEGFTAIRLYAVVDILPGGTRLHDETIQGMTRFDVRYNMEFYSAMPGGDAARTRELLRARFPGCGAIHVGFITQEQQLRAMRRSQQREMGKAIEPDREPVGGNVLLVLAKPYVVEAVLAYIYGSPLVTGPPASVHGVVYQGFLERVKF